MIVFDTETTGLVKASAVPLDQQPHIIEFAGIKLDDDSLEEIDRIQFLCKPPVKLDAKITEITGLTDKDLEDKPPFSHYLPDLQKFFFKEWKMLAHNLSFDRSMMGLELKRLNKLPNFPWPPEHICTVERSYDINGHRLNLTKLHQLATGQDHINNAHRAMNDVEALVVCVKWLREQGRL